MRKKGEMKMRFLRFSGLAVFVLLMLVGYNSVVLTLYFLMSAYAFKDIWLERYEYIRLVLSYLAFAMTIIWLYPKGHALLLTLTIILECYIWYLNSKSKIRKMKKTVYKRMPVGKRNSYRGENKVSA